MERTLELVDYKVVRSIMMYLYFLSRMSGSAIYTLWTINSSITDWYDWMVHPPGPGLWKGLTALRTETRFIFILMTVIMYK